MSLGSGLKTLGLKPNQVVGMSVEEVYRDNSPILDSTRRALAGEELRLTYNVGERYYDAYYIPSRSPSGQVTGAIGVALDVTARIKAETMRERLSTAVEQSDEEIFLTDRDGVDPVCEQGLRASDGVFQT